MAFVTFCKILGDISQGVAVCETLPAKLSFGTFAIAVSEFSETFI